MINNDEDHNHSGDESERQRLLQSLPIVPLNENILPLPGGRRAHTLIGYSQPDSKERQVMIDQMLEAFADELEQLDTLDDPLEVCVRYLRWITDTFPTGDNEESKLYDVLRSTCLRFQEDTRYISDIRYLKCWLDLAKHSDEPKDIYEFLMQKGIGQHQALFYEKYSNYYEEREKYKEGRLVLEQGIKRGAQPVARLELTLEHYIARTKSDQAQPSRPSLLPPNSTRKVLGVKTDPKLRESMSQTSYNSIQNSLASSSSTGGLSLGLSGRSLRDTSSIQQRSKEFYVATDHNLAHTSSLSTTQEDLLDRVFPPAPSSPTHTPKASSTRFSRHPQENRPAVEKIAGSTMPLDANYVRPSKFQIDICRDEDDDALPTHQPHLDNTPSPIPASPPLRPSPPTLRNIPNIHPNEHAALLQSRCRLKGDLYLDTTDSAGNPQRVVALAECLGGTGSNKPISFAELRLIRRVDRNGNPQKINGKARERPSLPIADVSIPGRLGRAMSPTMEYTTETYAAMKSIGEIFGGQHVEDEEDEEDEEARQPKRSKHVYVDENQ